MDIGSLIAALLLGFVAGAIGRALVPNDAFRAMSGWKSWAASTILGLLGALLGYWIFTGLFGIGDSDKFDWGGIIGAIIGAIIVVAVGSAIIKRMGANRAGTPGTGPAGTNRPI
ncbi:GlsB/YeaQ/YmgE family stress response membrane protein [Gordonia sp. CPCC 205515]|uniref:GlsB/YeaQ/YmgE family stress response membrane protein n=1 Tax=Gordonia sp. CPCC 205515 TaxID=3140791 RepID=UPI003AF40357